MYRTSNVMLRIFLQTTLLILSFGGINFQSVAATNAEETFLQGQRQLEQDNIAQASVSLAHLPSQSPYAKLLAGNIAAKQGDVDQAFLLLLPLQSNTQLTKPAAASLHASLSSAYEKQGAYFNALEQKTRYETFLGDPAAIERNHADIWRLLTPLTIENLVELRGESTDTVIQGWIDLALTAKQQNNSDSVNAWINSYADHPALAFASNMRIEKTVEKPATPADAAPIFLKEGIIALILPFGEGAEGAKAEAFKLGLQAALAVKSLPNEIKTYSALGDQESFADLYAIAKDEGAAYIIGPMTQAELNPNNSNIQALTLLDSAMVSNPYLQHGGLSLTDEAAAIANFASRNAIQHISILASDSPQAQMQVAAFVTDWKTKSDQAVNVITLPADVKFRTLLDLKDTIAAQPNEMLLLALSAQEAIKVKPYLDISIPTVGFSSVNNLQGEKPVALHAVRFVDIPFLTDYNNADFSTYREASAALGANELKRWFALGADYLALLAAKSNSPGTEMMVIGLTGTLQIDANGQLKRQLPLARFTHDSVVLDNH
jgi:outer membrane PBP1 activator LpoA protein